MIVKRVWKKCSELQIFDDTAASLDIWDGGSHRYERFPGGQEICWEVMGRDLTETGFTERLRVLPSWEVPSKVFWEERVVILSSPSPSLIAVGSSFQIPEWVVSVESVEEELVQPPSVQKVHHQRSEQHHQQPIQPQRPPHQRERGPRQAQPRQAQPRQEQPRQAQPRQVQPRQAQPRQAQRESALGQQPPRQAQPRQAQPRQAQPRQAYTPLVEQ